MTIPYLSDSALRQTLANAHIPSLMNALVHLTGDMRLLRGDIHPQSGFLSGEHCGISEAHQEEMRALAFKTIRDYQRTCQDNPQHSLATLSHEQVQEMTEFIVGKTLAGDYRDMLGRELAIEDTDTFAHDSFAGIPPQARQDCRVIIIGAGMSGLLAGKRLKEEGIDFLIIDKNADVGGTWLENTYPGCRVDSANHMYSYSFEPHDWPQHFSDQKVLLGYFQQVADKYQLREHLRLGVEASEAMFDETRGEWRVRGRHSDGSSFEARGKVLIMATGQLNRPRFPDIPDRHCYEGISFHSARWEHHHDLTGKRIGVIGTGASALQFVPEIAEACEQVTVFQRSPPWVMHTPEYHDFITEEKHWLLNHLPFYGKWFRFWVFHVAGEGLLDSVKRDPEWSNPRSVSQENHAMSKLMEKHIRNQLAGRPDLVAASIPHYPFGAKRGLRDNGAWFRTLKRANVELVTAPIERIHPGGVRCQDGRSFDCDVLVYGTGFRASEFFFPIRIRGTGGKSLETHWQGDPRAYLGITVPDFPNLFVLYGPNTNIVINASITFFSECEVRYVMGCIRLLLARKASSMNCKQAVHDAYNAHIDQGNEQMAWSTPGVSTWYKNAAGRVTQNWPFSMLEFWNQTKSPKPEDYVFS